MLKLQPSKPTKYGNTERISIECNQNGDSYQAVQLIPKYESEIVAGDDELLEVFKAPLKISVSEATDINVMVSASVRTETNVNFFNFTSTYYSTGITFVGKVTGDEWLLADGTTSQRGRTRITGASGY